VSPAGRAAATGYPNSGLTLSSQGSGGAKRRGLAVAARLVVLLAHLLLVVLRGVNRQRRVGGAGLAAPVVTVRRSTFSQGEAVRGSSSALRPLVRPRLPATR
jgi:hypothetical protein